MPTQRRPLPSTQGVIAIGLFAVTVMYAAVVSGACGCFTCQSGLACALSMAGSNDVLGSGYGSAQGYGSKQGDDEEVPYAEFRVADRWTSTSFNGSTGTQGNPITLSWGIVADGTAIPGDAGDPSSLVSMLNSLYGAGPGGVSNAPWFRLFEDAFARWSEVSGITYVYEPNDGGAAIDGSASPLGQTGVYADVRIGGHPIFREDGNTLAYNFFPDHADMVIDTDDRSFYNNRTNDSRNLRNVLMHEAGHGLGFNHVESSNSGQLMEPFIQSEFDGPQIDDILAAHRNYGDVLEKNGGNDTQPRATQVGVMNAGERWSLGVDGSARVVTSSMTDFLSIDGSRDRDFYEFTVSSPVDVQIVISQVGLTYSEGPQNGDQMTLVTSELNPLNLSLYSSSATSGIALVADAVPRTITRKNIVDVTLFPGIDYSLYVRGTMDNVQLYRLDMLFTASAVPEPLALAMLLTAAPMAIARRRAA